MKRMRRTRDSFGGRLGSLGVLLLLVCTASCGKEPAELRQRASETLDQARDAQAEIYAPAEYRAALDSLGLAREELVAQKGKFAMARRFDRTEQLFQAAARAAERALETAVANKQSTKDEALATLASVQSMVAEVDVMFESPEGQSMLRERRTGPSMRSLRNEMADVDQTLSNVEDALQNLQYRDALAMASSAKKQAALVHAEVGEAIETGVIPSRGPK